VPRVLLTGRLSFALKDPLGEPSWVASQGLDRRGAVGQQQWAHEGGGQAAHRRHRFTFVTVTPKAVVADLVLYSPTSPSMASRRRSACPLCRAYSSIMCVTIHLRFGAP
jgi:hypothetical protein